MAAALVAMSAFGACAADRAADGLRLKQRGWTASLFVSPGASTVPEVRWLDPQPTVNARLWRRVAKTARVSIDFTNLLDRPVVAAPGASFTEPAPVPGRGLVLRFRKTF